MNKREGVYTEESIYKHCLTHGYIYSLERDDELYKAYEIKKKEDYKKYLKGQRKEG